MRDLRGICRIKKNNIKERVEIYLSTTLLRKDDIDTSRILLILEAGSRDSGAPHVIVNKLVRQSHGKQQQHIIGGAPGRT